MKAMLKTGIALFLFAAASLVYAQTADELETLLNTAELNYAQAARFVLEASDAAVYQNPQEAFAYAQEQNWVPKNAQAEDLLHLDAASLLIMRSFSLHGGIFYSLFKTPHYAYHELVYQEVILGKTDPGQTVSGELLLQLIGRLVYHEEQAGE